MTNLINQSTGPTIDDHFKRELEELSQKEMWNGYLIVENGTLKQTHVFESLWEKFKSTIGFSSKTDKVDEKVFEYLIDHEKDINNKTDIQMVVALAKKVGLNANLKGRRELQILVNVLSHKVLKEDEPLLPSLQKMSERNELNLGEKLKELLNRVKEIDAVDKVADFSITDTFISIHPQIETIATIKKEIDGKTPEKESESQRHEENLAPHNDATYTKDASKIIQVQQQQQQQQQSIDVSGNGEIKNKEDEDESNTASNQESAEKEPSTQNDSSANKEPRPPLEAPSYTSKKTTFSQQIPTFTGIPLEQAEKFKVIEKVDGLEIVDAFQPVNVHVEPKSDAKAGENADTKYGQPVVQIVQTYEDIIEKLENSSTDYTKESLEDYPADTAYEKLMGVPFNLNEANPIELNVHAIFLAVQNDEVDNFDNLINFLSNDPSNQFSIMATAFQLAKALNLEKLETHILGLLDTIMLDNAANINLDKLKWDIKQERLGLAYLAFKNATGTSFYGYSPEMLGNSFQRKADIVDEWIFDVFTAVEDRDVEGLETLLKHVSFGDPNNMMRVLMAANKMHYYLDSTDTRNKEHAKIESMLLSAQEKNIAKLESKSPIDANIKYDKNNDKNFAAYLQKVESAEIRSKQNKTMFMIAASTIIGFIAPNLSHLQPKQLWEGIDLENPDKPLELTTDKPLELTPNKSMEHTKEPQRENTSPARPLSLPKEPHWNRNISPAPLELISDKPYSEGISYKPNSSNVSQSIENSNESIEKFGKTIPALPLSEQHTIKNLAVTGAGIGMVVTIANLAFSYFTPDPAAERVNENPHMFKNEPIIPEEIMNIIIGNIGHNKSTKDFAALKQTSKSIRQQVANNYQGRLTNLKIKNADQAIDYVKEFGKELHYMDITHIDFSDPNKFADFLKYIPNLKAFKADKIGNQGAQIIGESATLKNLVSLELIWARIGNEGLKKLANSENLKNLQKLNLHGNDIDAEGTKSIAESENFKKLVNLNLAYNPIANAGVRSIATSEILKSIDSLNLDSCSIGMEGAEELSDSETLVNLKNLNLSRNRIGEAGATTIARSRMKNLESLNLDDNKIGDEGLKEIVHSETMKNLLILNLQDNLISNMGVKEIIGSKNLKNLIKLDLVGNNIKGEGWWELKRYRALQNIKIHMKFQTED